MVKYIEVEKGKKLPFSFCYYAKMEMKKHLKAKGEMDAEPHEVAYFGFVGGCFLEKITPDFSQEDVIQWMSEHPSIEEESTDIMLGMYADLQKQSAKLGKLMAPQNGKPQQKVGHQK